MLANRHSRAPACTHTDHDEMLMTLTTPDHSGATVDHDVANLTPRAEVQLLQDSGLVALRGPAE